MTRTEDQVYSAALKAYVRGLFGKEDAVLAGVARRAELAGLPAIAIGPEEGRFLQLMALAVRAERALEIGTLGGYSGLWIARGLGPSGRLVTLELDPEHAAVAEETFRQAGLEEHVSVQVGPALETLPRLADDPPFDLVFIDADKDRYPDYLDWALRLTRPGAAVLAHNAFRGGAVVAPSDAGARAVDAFNRRLAEDPRLVSTVVPLRDGMSLSIVKDTDATGKGEGDG